MKEEELIAGNLYQAKDPYKKNKWVIAIYVKTAEAHSYNYHSVNMHTLKSGPEKTKHVPRSFIFKSPRSNRETYGSFPVTDIRDVRPVTDECAAEVARLREAVQQKKLELSEAEKELREFCE
jgi:hypothetical protein